VGLTSRLGSGGVCKPTDCCGSFMIYNASLSISISGAYGKLPIGKVLVCHLAVVAFSNVQNPSLDCDRHGVRAVCRSQFA
jgi:hypothetical protein